MALLLALPGMALGQETGEGNGGNGQGSGAQAQQATEETPEPGPSPTEGTDEGSSEEAAQEVESEEAPEEQSSEEESEDLAEESAAGEELDGGDAEQSASRSGSEAATTQRVGVLQQGGPSAGTIKVQGDEIDAIPQNQPFQGCEFDIVFAGFDPGGEVEATLTLVPPTTPETGSASTTETGTVPGGGGGANEVTLTIGVTDIPGFAFTDPKIIAGQPFFHIRIDAVVEGEVTKSKVIWALCEPEGVIPTSGIDVAKACPDTAVVGEEIDYDITVTNIGEVILTDLVVTDTLLGPIGGFPSTLNPGQSVTVTVSRVSLETDPLTLTNTVTATAIDEFEDEVTDSASCVTELSLPVLPRVFIDRPLVLPGPPQPREAAPALAVTGFGMLPLVLAVLALVGAGGGFLVAGRRRSRNDPRRAGR